MAISPAADRARFTALAYAIAVPLNYAWELLQVPLYAGSEAWNGTLWHCFRAALGDGLLVLAIHFLVAAVARDFRWHSRTTISYALIMLAAGILIGFAVEWWGVRWTGRWAYSGLMWIIPGTGVGAAPVAQMLALPAIVFWLARKMEEHLVSHAART